jgi:hypothetical protein
MEMKNPPLINAQQALDGLREAVAERGRDYVDPNATTRSEFSVNRCRYVQDHKPSCIGAQALSKAGVTVEELTRWEGNSALAMAPGAYKSVGLVGNAIPQEYGIVTTAAAAILARAQDGNDGGRPWGKILDDVTAWALRNTIDEGGLK